MRARLSVVISIAVLAAIGVWDLHDTPAGPISNAATTNEIATHRDTVRAEPSRAIDVVARYEADRDNVNAIPRLALIEQWARERKSDESVDLLTQALVDPDERVRARAQELLDRALAQR